MFRNHHIAKNRKGTFNPFDVTLSETLTNLSVLHRRSGLPEPMASRDLRTIFGPSQVENLKSPYC